MKVLSLATFSFLATAVASACPQLQGTYQCSGAQGTAMVSIMQTELNGVTTYIIDGDQMVSDGAPHSANFDGVNGTYISQCQPNGLSVSLQGKGSQPDVTIELNLQLNLTLTATGYQASQAGVVVLNGEVQQVNDVTSCNRL